MKDLPQAVFVVDDDDAVRDSLRLLLKSAGIPCEVFASAQEFLSAYDPAQPGCLVLDVRMPGMGGLEFLESLRSAEQTREIPVILMTESPSDCSALAYEKGAVDCLVKPIDALVLNSKVRVFVKLYRQRREILDAQRRLRAVMDAASEMRGA